MPYLNIYIFSFFMTNHWGLAWSWTINEITRTLKEEWVGSLCGPHSLWCGEIFRQIFLEEHEIMIVSQIICLCIHWKYTVYNLWTTCRSLFGSIWEIEPIKSVHNVIKNKNISWVLRLFFCACYWSHTICDDRSPLHFCLCWGRLIRWGTNQSHFWFRTVNILMK